MRKEAFAGKFYPSDAKELKEMIKGLSLKANTKKIPKKILAAISPHAGYEYSGKAASSVYSAIAESWKKEKQVPELFIILGTNHTGYAEADFSLSFEDFETPLGIAKNDKEFGKKLLELSSADFNIKKDEHAHIAEHSIEVQLPFLQYFFRDFKILPIMINNLSPESCEALVDALFDTVEEMKMKAVLIASSDFTHFGYIYGFMPFTSDIKKNLYELDGKAIKKIIDFDTPAFVEFAEKTTICGSAPIAVAIEYARKFDCEKGFLIDYYTSADIAEEENYKNAVGYAAIVFS